MARLFSLMGGGCNLLRYNFFDEASLSKMLASLKKIIRLTPSLRAQIVPRNYNSWILEPTRKRSLIHAFLTFPLCSGTSSCIPGEKVERSIPFFLQSFLV